MSGAVLSLLLYAFIARTTIALNVQGRMPSLDLFSIIGSNVGTYCAQKNCRFYFKYITVFPVTQTTFHISNLSITVRKKKLFYVPLGLFIAVATHQWTALSPPVDHQYDININIIR